MADNLSIKQSVGVESMKYGEEKPKYRILKKKFGRTYINILHDPRVVRGNTYAAFVIPSSLQKEFMRIKEDEEKRHRMIFMPSKLPRVAYLSQNKTLEENVEENEKQPDEDDNFYDNLEVPEEAQDSPYFFEDRPPTPKFIPLPPGREIATQIEDGELFDFELEVRPILEVLVGRSLVQARYELIEEDERKEYLEHKKKYDQKREFELINLQRSEAARIRREEEKVRRQKQVFEKKNNDIFSQKKLICKTFAKSHLKFLKRNTINHLLERGFLKENNDLKLNSLINNDLLPKIEKDTEQYYSIEKIIHTAFENNMNNELKSIHKKIVNKEKERLTKLKEENEERIKLELLNENKRKKERAEHIENKRVNRITNSLKENIISTKFSKQSVINIPLYDIDELSFKSDSIHCVGGHLGQAMIILDQILRTLAENNSITNDSVNIPDFIEKFLEEFLLNQLKENAYLELRYLESSKYDFKDIPIEEVKRKEYHEFMLDDRRFVNKSLKLLLEKGILTEYVYRSVLEAVAKVFLFQPVDPSSIEIDMNNQDEAYIESIEKMKTKIELENKKLMIMKRKIKLEFVNPEDLKKKRDNIGGFLTVQSNNQVVETLIELEEPIVENKIISQLVNNNSNPIQENNIDALNYLENPTQVDKENLIKETDLNIPQNIEAVVEPIQLKVDYLNEVDLFRNSTMPIDTYILHYDLTECFIAFTIRSIKRVLRKNYKVNIDLNDSFNSMKDKIHQISANVFDYVIEHENYKGKTIIHIDVKPEISKENPEVI